MCFLGAGGGGRGLIGWVHDFLVLILLQGGFPLPGEEGGKKGGYRKVPFEPPRGSSEIQPLSIAAERRRAAYLDLR